MSSQVSRELAKYNANGIGPLVDGADTAIFVDQYGNLLTTSGTLAGGEDIVNNRQIVEQRWQYSYNEQASSSYNVAASIKSGIFHKVVVSDIGGGGYFIIKDSTDGTGTTTLAVLVPTDACRSFEFDIPFNVGLNLAVNNTTSSQPMKFVVMFRENAA
jgi:hypothetical protein